MATASPAPELSLIPIFIARLDQLKARRLKVLETETFEVCRRRQTFNSVGVSLIGTGVVPKPVLPTIRENYERCPNVFRIAARLVLRIVRI